MQTSIETADVTSIETDWLLVAVDHSGQTLGFSPAAALRTQLAAMGETKDLTGKSSEIVVLFQPDGFAAKRLMLVGVGDPTQATVSDLGRAFSSAAKRISGAETNSVTVINPGSIGRVVASKTVEIIAISCCVASVGQDLYKAEKTSHPITSLIIQTTDASDLLSSAAERGATIGSAVNLTKEVVNRAPHDIYPDSFAQRAQQVATATGLTCRILDEKQLAAENMNSMLAVAQGSDKPARLAILEYRGAGDEPVLGLVGKGVTFDSGGLSLKPNDGMKTMKCDMAGAGTVLGVMQAVAELKMRVNINGYMGLVENMPSANAYKLGDVLTARNGKTIEVLNTDAEGRLVLADVLAFAVDEGMSHLVDLATLTGACVVALGEEITGSFTNDQDWCDRLNHSADVCCEHVWQMPMHDHFGDLLKGTVSDIKNVGPRWGGAVTAAKFLEHFVAETPWIHLDIAGPSFADAGTAWRDGGATGCMVRTLIDLAERYNN